jgi:release factor glutamine methyltransferase
MLISTKRILICNKAYYRLTVLRMVKHDPSLKVNSHPMVYEPSEDTHFLLEHANVSRGEKVLEIGSGSGLIALNCARIADVTAIDINPHAVALTKSNAILNGLEIEVLRSDLFEGVRGSYDAIIFNPPYLEGQRGKDGALRDVQGEWLEKAWDGGQDGEEVILRFLESAGEFIKLTGRIFTLISSGNRKALDEMKARFRLKILGSKSFFFEVIRACELARK